MASAFQIESVHVGLRHDPLACADCPVRDAAVCAGLGDEERAALARFGRRQIFNRGDIVFLAGDSSNACATLVSGALRLSRIDAEGVERTLAIVHASGFLARLFATSIDCTATALTRSELCLFPRAEIERQMAAHPGLMERILRATVEQLEQSRDHIDLIGRRTARAKVAGLLLMFGRGGCAGNLADGYVLELPLTRGEMSGLLGLTIETVSRQLTLFEAAGVIRRMGLRQIMLRDLAALETAAG